MSVKLIVRQRSEEEGSPEAQGKELILVDPVITLGRDKTAQVVLPLQAVSRAHARISRDGALFFIEDLGSVYGTQINGQTLPKGEKRLLREGDLIGIAQFDIIFGRVVEVPPEAPDQTSMVARQMVKNAMRAISSGSGPYLRIMNGPDEGKHVPLPDARELVFGRDDDVDVVLKDDLTSRRHAKIRRDWAGSHVEDLGSRNGVRVNRKRVTRKTLTDRDEVEIGGVKLLYIDPSDVQDGPPPPGPPVDEGENTPPPRDAEEEDPPTDEADDADADDLADDEPSEASKAEDEPAEDEESSEVSAAGLSEAMKPPGPAENLSAADEDVAPAEVSAPESESNNEEAFEEEQGDEDGENEEEALEREPESFGIPQWVILGLASSLAIGVLGMVVWVLLGA